MKEDKKLEAYVEKLWEEYKHEIETGGKPVVMVCSMSLLTDLHRRMECLDAILVDEELGSLFVSYEVPGVPGSSTACVGEKVSEISGLVCLKWNGCDCKVYSHMFIGEAGCP